MSIWCFCAIWCFINKLSTLLFGVIYLATSFGLKCLLCYIFAWTFWCPSWCFMNVTIIFGDIAILAKCYLVVNHIIINIESVTFLFGVIAISPILLMKGAQRMFICLYVPPIRVVHLGTPLWGCILITGFYPILVAL